MMSIKNVGLVLTLVLSLSIMAQEDLVSDTEMDQEDNPLLKTVCYGSRMNPSLECSKENEVPVPFLNAVGKRFDTPFLWESSKASNSAKAITYCLGGLGLGCALSKYGVPTLLTSAVRHAGLAGALYYGQNWIKTKFASTSTETTKTISSAVTSSSESVNNTSVSFKTRLASFLVSPKATKIAMLATTASFLMFNRTDLTFFATPYLPITGTVLKGAGVLGTLGFGAWGVKKCAAALRAYEIACRDARAETQDL